MKVETVSQTAATITFSRKELYLFLSVINETTNGIHLNLSRKERLGRSRELAHELREEIYRVLDAA